MSWLVKVNIYGSVEECEVEAVTLSDALVEALDALGLDDNDEGSLTIVISGEAS